jgi:phosphohistidine phosphatase
MRRLILMRHAKAVRETRDGDHGRALEVRGRLDATKVARALVSHDWLPDLILASDSTRTVETWACVAGELPGDPSPPWFRRSLYHAGLGALQRELETVPGEVHTVLAIGHNPGWELAASVYATANLEMGTGYAACLELFDEPWRDAARRPARRLAHFIRPKDIPEP